jgi:REP element-mobilizing transposase RayT
MGNTNINTYTQIHLQFVFAVKYRQAQIDNLWKADLHKFITGIIQKKTNKMLAINTMPDHLHMVIGFRPFDCISNLIQTVKIESTNFINEYHFTNKKFEWQGGF